MALDLADKDSTILRFRIGTRVECNVGNWMLGTVTQQFYVQSSFAEGKCAAYQVKLDEGNTIFAPADVDRVVRAAAGRESTIAQVFFDSLSNTQREQLATMKNMSEEEHSALGKFLVSASVEHCTPMPSSTKVKLSEDEGGTGPALAAFCERALAFKYITRPEHDRIIARISGIATAEEREAAAVAAMRRFVANTQPLGRMMLVDCPVRHKRYPDVDLNGIIVHTEGLPGGTPERYNVTVPLKQGKKGKMRGFKPKQDDDEAEVSLLVQVQPRYMRPIPIEHDYSDECHDIIPEDHMADAWFNEEVARYEKDLPIMMALGGLGEREKRPE